MERRSPTGIARQRETRTNDATPHQPSAWSAGLRPASRGSAKPGRYAPPTLTAWSAGLRPASRGSAKPAPTTLRPPTLTAWSAGLRPASRGSAKPAPMTPRQREIRTSDHQGFSRRKPPTGTAAHRAAKPHIAQQEKARGRLGTPTSGRHSPPKAGGRDEPPTPARLPSQHPLHQPSRDGAPVSDRHRAAARNPHQRRRANVRIRHFRSSGAWKPPTGTAAHRAAKPHIAKQEKARGRLGTPTSGQFSPAQPAEGGRT